MNVRRLQVRASVVFSLLAASAVGAASLAWTGCSGGDESASLGSALGAADGVGKLVISQVYGAGGNGTGASKAPWSNDYVELFNAGTADITISGWSVQYASASSGAVAEPALLADATIKVGEYYLVQMGPTKTGYTPLPTADDIPTHALSLASTAGTVFLVDNQTQLTCTSKDTCAGKTDIVDLVGFGDTPTYLGSGPAAAISTTTAAFRAGAGCTDVGDNSLDFAPAAAAPRTSASPLNACAGGGDAGTDAGDDASSDAGDEADADAGRSDAGTKDGGSKDAGDSDSGTGGGGSKDAGTKDAGPGVGSNGGTGSSGVVISQVYGGGSNANATFDSDYVELFNRGAEAVSLSGLSLQYGSAEGDFASAVDGGDPNLVNLPDMMIQPGQYLLVGMGTPGSTGAALPPVDIPGTASLGAASGKIALVNGTKSLACGGSGDPCPTTAFVDLIGYGTVSQFEGSGAAPALSSVLAGFRANGGCTDTDENQSDISAQLPAPRTSATALNVCSPPDQTGGNADGGSGSGGDDNSGDDDSSGDDDDSTGNKNTVTTVPSSSGCSVAGAGSTTGNDVASFGAFAFVALAFAGRRKKSRG